MIRIFLLFFLLGNAFALEYDVQTNFDDVYDVNRNFVVERENFHKFKKESFENKTNEILDKMNSHPTEDEFKIDLKGHSQGLFIERYFKIHSQDAYIDKDGILIIKKKKLNSLSESD